MSRINERKNFAEFYIPKNCVGAEIGVHRGDFTRVLNSVAQPTKLHLIDPWYLIGSEWSWGDGDRSTTRALSNLILLYEEELSSGLFELNIGFDYDVLPHFEDGYFDWVYLDSSHTYDNTVRELEHLKRKVKKTGVIAGDDWWPDELHPLHGVYRAVQEFLQNEPYQLIYANPKNLQWAITCK